MTEDLFQNARKKQIEAESPLANRMRPRTLEEYVGQEHIIGPGRLLRRAIQADQLSSLIFYGPPGTGKTTLAMVIANTTSSHFITINAVLAGVKEIRQAIADAQDRRNLYNQRTTLFVDEVHRWNKAQQDALLPHVERGTIILIGATTENPFFEVNKALVSRSRIFQLKPLEERHLRMIVAQTVADKARGYGNLNIRFEEDALDHLVQVANGDARSLLNALELALETTEPDGEGVVHIDLAVAEESIQQRAVLYDKDGDVHYDTISAFIKSLRGSDPDAAMYWMAKMVYAGEDPRFIFRRMGIFAGEDVGLADPNAASVVESCWALYERIGMPEGQFPLAQAALYLATAPKSNSAFAFFDALKSVQAEQEAEVPNHLKDANRDAKEFGHGKGYLYPHAYQNHWVAQQYLPTGLQGRLFYQPSENGYEKEIAAEVARKREGQLALMVEQSYGLSEGGEVLTYSPPARQVERWLQRTMESATRSQSKMRDLLIESSHIQRHHLVLIINDKNGLLTWETVRQVPEGGVWCLPATEPVGDLLTQQAERLPELNRPKFLKDLAGIPADIRFDRIFVTERFLRRTEEQIDFLSELSGFLRDDGFIIVGQRVPSAGQRLSQFFDAQTKVAALAKLEKAETEIYTDSGNPLVNWNESALEQDLVEAGYTVDRFFATDIYEARFIGRALLEKWFSSGPDTKETKHSLYQRLVANGAAEDDLKAIRAALAPILKDRTVEWRIRFGVWISSRGKGNAVNRS